MRQALKVEKKAISIRKLTACQRWVIRKAEWWRAAMWAIGLSVSSAGMIVGPQADELSAASAAPGCSGYTVCPAVSSRTLFTSSDARKVLTAITNSENNVVSRLGHFASLTTSDKKVLIGAAILFDFDLSVHRNQTCDFCHTRDTGFTGGMSVINNVTVAYFGSQGSPHLDGTPTSGARASARRPITYGYSVFAPKLSVVNNNLVGGLFWDMRATGFITGDPAIDQAMGPYTNAVEQGFPDPGCAVLTVSRARYASEFRSLWGANSFNINWPSNVDQLCAKPNSSDAPAPQVLFLSATDRSQVHTTFKNIAASVVALERSNLVSPFSSTYDRALCGNATFTAAETRGLNVFLGKGKCANCHTAVAPNPPRTCGAKPLFTNFKAVNLGVPRNPTIPFLHENAPDNFGFVANPAGTAFVDNGVGDFLRTLDANQPHNPVASMNPSLFDGSFRVPPLRNTTRTPRSGFVRAYGHNGVFKSVDDVVHFHATRDTLVECPNNNPKQAGFGVTCWPRPEQSKNMDTSVGRLPLTPSDEADVVSFLSTLDDISFGAFP